jgi:hypothetical protein
MTGVLLTQIRNDVKNIITAGGFETDIELVSADNSVTIETTGIATLHNSQIDPETGSFVNQRTGHIVIDTKDLVEKGFPLYVGKDTKEPYLKNVKVTWTDAQSIERVMYCDDVRPSHSFGTLTIMLKDTK